MMSVRDTGWGNGAAYLDTGIIRGPSDESQLVSGILSGKYDINTGRSSIPHTVAGSQVVLEVVYGVAGTLADSALLHR